jgi:hypothetical protein
MEKKFTQGQWYRSTHPAGMSGYSIRVAFKTEDGEAIPMIANCSLENYKRFLSNDSEEFKTFSQWEEYNAKLIAAAPDLLQALEKTKKELYDLMSHCVDRKYIDFEDETEGVKTYHEAIELATSAIAKALS